MDTGHQGTQDQYDNAWLKGLIFMFGLLVVLMLITG
jgi:hypothetical protein